LTYEMTLPGGEKVSRTCTPKEDLFAIDALGPGIAGRQLNIRCPAVIGTMVSEGGAFVALKNYIGVTTFEFDNKIPDTNAWDMGWQSGINSGADVSYGKIIAANGVDNNASCLFKGVNDETEPRISGTLDCTWSNGASLTLEFDTAYVLP